jgi:hypothetical protein
MEIPESWLGRQAAMTAARIIGIAVLIVIGIPVGTAFWAVHSETEDALSQLALYRAEMGLKPKLEAELAAVQMQAASGTGLIVADDSALAEAQVQREVKSLVENNVGEVRSTQVAAKKPVGGLEEISIQYDLSVPITRLNPLLYAIESHAPYLFIDHATISGGLGWQQPQPAGKKQSEPKLDVRLTVRAYRWSAK